MSRVIFLLFFLLFGLSHSSEYDEYYNYDQEGKRKLPNDPHTQNIILIFSLLSNVKVNISIFNFSGPEDPRPWNYTFHCLTPDEIDQGIDQSKS